MDNSTDSMELVHRLGHCLLLATVATGTGCAGRHTSSIIGVDSSPTAVGPLAPRVDTQSRTTAPTLEPKGDVLTAEQRGDTTWMTFAPVDRHNTMVELGYRLRADGVERVAPSVVVDSIVVTLRPNEMPFGNCGERGQHVIALIQRGSREAAARLAWKVSVEERKLVPIPPATAKCRPEAYD